jgi:hypothetical protein
MHQLRNDFNDTRVLQQPTKSELLTMEQDAPLQVQQLQGC